MKLSNVPEWLGRPAARRSCSSCPPASVRAGCGPGRHHGHHRRCRAERDEQPVSGAAVIAIHLPSGTSYEAKTRSDGRFFIPGVRVGGPYSVTVTFEGGAGTAFQPETQDRRRR